VIVVDDGSTDTSPEIIREYELKNPQIIALLKKNEGQLSCFNAAVDYIPEDSQVFLLDSDDCYPKNYLEALIQKIDLPTDFCFVSAVEFFNGSKPPQDAHINDHKNGIFPKTVALVMARNFWIGNVTSAISISGKYYKKIIPYPFVSDWKTRADDIFIYIASLLGAKKTRVSSVGIGYRKHNFNSHILNKYF
jgi:glycosyltransferase involved in cell wall biosynthesis